MNVTTHYSIRDLMNELSTWVRWSDEERSMANLCVFHVENCPALREMVSDWSDGMYDEDMCGLENRVTCLLEEYYKVLSCEQAKALEWDVLKDSGILEEETWAHVVERQFRKMGFAYTANLIMPYTGFLTNEQWQQLFPSVPESYIAFENRKWGKAMKK